jgi:hypothetical protein
VTHPQRYATEAPRTAPLASMALAVSLLFGPMGIALGIVALRRIERDNEPGARTAVAAIAVGVVITVVYAVLITVVVMLFVEASHQPIPPGI